ncbi:MAG: hypothetical protein C0P64_000950 [Bacillota bacterium]|jgi:hypothetical protein|nr:hypothetical protein [Bacillota bacterium]
MEERTILAAFRSEDDARTAARRLRDLGIAAVDIGRVHPYPHEGAADRPTHPLTGRIQSLANLTLGAADPNPDAAALLAADVSASGMADGNPFELGRDIVLTAVVPAARAAEAERIVRDAGGRL